MAAAAASLEAGSRVKNLSDLQYCEIYNIQYTVYNRQYTIYNIQYTIYSINCLQHGLNLPTAVEKCPLATIAPIILFRGDLIEWELPFVQSSHLWNCRQCFHKERGKLWPYSQPQFSTALGKHNGRKLWPYSQPQFSTAIGKHKGGRCGCILSHNSWEQGKHKGRGTRWLYSKPQFLTARYKDKEGKAVAVFSATILDS